MILSIIVCSVANSVISSPNFGPFISFLDRYSHTAHVVGDKLILLGGINPTDHYSPDLVIVDLSSRDWVSYSFSVSTITDSMGLRGVQDICNESFVHHEAKD